MPPPPLKTAPVPPSATAPHRRSRPPPAAGSPGFRFPAPHPYAANATPTPPMSPLEAVGPQPRAVTPEERLVQEMGFEVVERSPVHASPPRSKTSPTAPTAPLPPLPSSASPPSRPLRDPFRDPPGALAAISTAPVRFDSPVASPDADPSYTVSGIAASAHPTERKGSDASYRAHDSPMPFRSFGGANAPGHHGAAHSPSSSAETARPLPARQVPPAERSSLSLADIDEKDDLSEKRYQAVPVAAIAPPRRGAGDVRSVSEASSAARRKAVKKWVALVTIALVVIGAIAGGVGVTVSRNRAAEEEKREAASSGSSSAPTAAGASSAAHTASSASAGATHIHSDSSLPTVLATAPDDAPSSSVSALARVPNVDSTQARFVTQSRTASADRTAASSAGETTVRSTRRPTTASSSEARTTARARTTSTDERTTTKRAAASAEATTRANARETAKRDEVVEQVRALDARALEEHHAAGRARH
ncbi:hypothetical protein JCM10450v2_000609 [Rhodotorula kratochvilovae]